MTEFKIDFCGVGAAKAGTTWVTRQLMRHPQTCIGRRKELNFFMRNHPLEGFVTRTGSHFDSVNRERGLEWYEQQFDRCTPDQLTGELSTSYLADPESPALLKQHNPEIRLIMNYRNPVDALYSVYYQLNEMHPIRESFEELIDRSEDGLSYYKYSIHTKRYLEHFHRDQILFIFLDDIKRDAMEVYLRLCRFLGIDDTPVDAVYERVNPSKVVRSRALRDAILQIYILFDRNETLRSARDWLRRTNVAKLAHKIRKANSRPAKYPPMKPETRARLIEFFREDIEELARIHERDLSHWLAMPPEQPARADSATGGRPAAEFERRAGERGR
ncbi:MAG: hypothetical protein MAG453_02029 [Calditrichaeota bacterium]|nr:hypothetical protein [Calditrichota bacterium]